MAAIARARELPPQQPALPPVRLTWKRFCDEMAVELAAGPLSPSRLLEHMTRRLGGPLHVNEDRIAGVPLVTRAVACGRLRIFKGLVHGPVCACGSHQLSRGSGRTR